MQSYGLSPRPKKQRHASCVRQQRVSKCFVCAYSPLFSRVQDACFLFDTASALSKKHLGASEVQETLSLRLSYELNNNRMRSRHNPTTKTKGQRSCLQRGCVQRHKLTFKLIGCVLIEDSDPKSARMVDAANRFNCNTRQRHHGARVRSLKQKFISGALGAPAFDVRSPPWRRCARGGCATVLLPRQRTVAQLVTPHHFLWLHHAAHSPQPAAATAVRSDTSAVASQT